MLHWHSVLLLCRSSHLQLDLCRMSPLQMLAVAQYPIMCRYSLGEGGSPFLSWHWLHDREFNRFSFLYSPPQWAHQRRKTSCKYCTQESRLHFAEAFEPLFPVPPHKPKAANQNGWIKGALNSKAQFRQLKKVFVMSLSLGLLCPLTPLFAQHPITEAIRKSQRILPAVLAHPIWEKEWGGGYPRLAMYQIHVPHKFQFVHEFSTGDWLWTKNRTNPLGGQEPGD